MQILTSTNILDMVLDLIDVGLFHFLLVGLVAYELIYGVDMSSSVHVDNKKKDVLILGEGSQQDDTTLTAENKYLISFPVTRKKFI